MAATPFHPWPRWSSVLVSVLAAAGVVLAVASCSHVTPIGPDGTATPAMPPSRHLGSPIILQVMRSRPPTATSGCLAGWVMVPAPGGAPTWCYRPVGSSTRVTSAAVSAVSLYRPPPPGNGPAQYTFMVNVPAADVAAVTAVIKRAYASHDEFGISAGGKTWMALQVLGPTPPSGRRLQILLPTRKLAEQFHHMLVPSR
jgi:hypothetical protein